MGHVDHGKTSLLDAIRDASVADSEHGGITQHIGAYSVTLSDGRSLTFIDTPGHAAFTAMRSRGAQVTDIVVLVVAGDEGVMPQTIEALNHAKAAKVTIMVAVNKMDRPGASVDKVKQQLAEHGLAPEEWGGDTIYVAVSANTKQGIPALLESIALLAELKELKAVQDKRAQGVIIEAKQEKGRGAVATVLVQSGTLHVGDIFVSGAGYGRVRTMSDHIGRKIEQALPSIAVELTGFDELPEAGDDFIIVENESQAREISLNRAEKKKAKELRTLATSAISLEEFARRANNMAAMELAVVVKADMQGSVQAVRESLEKLSSDKVRVKVLHAAVGGVNESDVQLASASSAVIVGFGVKGEPRALSQAESFGIEVRFYRVIYELLDDVKKAMTGLLAPIKKELPLGRAEVRNTFSISKIGVIAGSFVISGVVKRNAKVRLLRDNRIIHEGTLSSLKRFKDDAKEVQNGYECGIGVEGYNDIKVGDVFEIYEIQEVAQTL
jgi:translation initiation factor IF-2